MYKITYVHVVGLEYDAVKKKCGGGGVGRCGVA